MQVKVWYSFMMGKIKNYLKNASFSIKITYQAAKYYFVLKSALSLLLSFVPIVKIYIWKIIIDLLISASANEMLTGLVKYATLYFTVHLVQELIIKMSQYIEYKYNDKVNYYVENLLLEQFAAVDLGFYDSSEYRDKLNQVWDIKSSVTALASLFFAQVQTLLSFIVSLILFARWNAAYALVIVLCSLPIIFVEWKVNQLDINFSMQNQKNERAMRYFKYIFTNYDNSLEIKLYNIKDFLIGKYIDSWKEYYKNRKKFTAKIAALMFVSLLISTFVSQLLLYILLIGKIAKKIISIGDAMYYMSLFHNLYNSTVSLIRIISSSNAAFVRLNAVKEFINQKPMVQKNGVLTLDKIQKIEFSHVYFRYPGKENYVLEDCSFTMEAGQQIGLVGENGCGKSTIVKLILRLYDVEEGEILLNGIDIMEYDIEKYRAMFSVLFQDFIKYSFTLRENVSLSDIEKSDNDERIKDALSKSEMSELVSTWDKGLETPLTRSFEPDGKELSGGQWQRIALSRVFFADRDFVILDEPSASLDVFAEEKIFHQFQQLSGNRSSIIISHRLSSIVAADKILVLKNGRILEQGKHKELLSKNGYYSELFYAQAQSYR
ncbi:aBC transporter related [Clostridium sp. CAG:448]|mgnify:FL=1|nr:aBC transporter related [Clostridium sp. CAG:448]